MTKNSIIEMLSVSLLGIKYHRMLVGDVNEATTSSLKENFDYSFIVAYGKFQDKEYELTNKNACLIDLNLGLEKIFGKFNSTSRNEVRRAEKIPELMFFKGYENSGFDNFYKFHSNCEKDRNWYPVPPEELRNSILFSTTFNGDLISGISCFSHEDRIRVGRIFSSKRSNSDKRINNFIYGCAVKRLVYNICEFSIKNHFTFLDLGGIDLNDPSKIGISRFKMSFGCDIVPVKIARWSNDKFRNIKYQIEANGWDLT
jgi:hypothetical protein